MKMPWYEQENKNVSRYCLKTASDGADAMSPPCAMKHW